MGLTQNCFHCGHPVIRPTGYSWKRFDLYKKQMNKWWELGSPDVSIEPHHARARGGGGTLELSMVLHPCPFTSKYVKSSTPQSVFSRVSISILSHQTLPVKLPVLPPIRMVPAAPVLSVLPLQTVWLTGRRGLECTSCVDFGYAWGHAAVATVDVLLAVRFSPRDVFPDKCGPCPHEDFLLPL